MPSAPGAITPDLTLLEQPIANAEFLVLDTETNGLWGEDCELVEVGAVLVGGGELHDRFSSLVRTQLPLRRGIRRLTGITQAMVDGAPELEAVIPRLRPLMEGRVLVAHNAPFDRRVLRQAFGRCGLEWPAPPFLCTAAMARVLLPLARERRLQALACSLDIDAPVAHRALADAETCARILCAVFPRLCANAGTVAEALQLLAPRRRRAARGTRKRQWSSAVRPELDFSELPSDPGVYLFRDAAGGVLYVGKSISIRSRARAHFAPSAPAADWTVHAAVVDYQPTCSELGALILENRLIKQHAPAGNIRLGGRDDRLVYIRCRLDIPFPILEVARQPAAGHAMNVGPIGGRALAIELVEQVDSLFQLRHCGRRMARREHPSAYGQMGRCLSPCLGDLDPNLYRRRLDEALRVLGAQGAGALLEHVEDQMRAAAGARMYERAAWLRRRLRRLRVILSRLDGLLAATHTLPMLLVASHPVDPARREGFWWVGGRLVDWGDISADAEEVARRSELALRRAGCPWEVGAHLPPDEVDEVRILTTYRASHPALSCLALDPLPDSAAVARFLTAAQENGSSETRAEDRSSPTPTTAPTSTSRRTRARAIGPRLGELATLPSRPTTRSSLHSS
jgi:DNA polymerase III subunit epsilon